MTIVMVVEGKTEVAIKPVLKGFLDQRCEAARKPKVSLAIRPLPAMLDKRKLNAVASEALTRADVGCVVALIDVYTVGRRFQKAEEAKAFLRSAMPDDDRCHAHAAQYEFEAWLLPFWEDICRSLGVRAQGPGARPEDVDLTKPPARRIAELYRRANRAYRKAHDGLAILRRNDITVAAEQCPELKSLLNTLLACAGLSARL